MEKKTISIIGGLGRMGALMARVFNEAGHQVAVFDAKQGEIDWKAAATAQVVLLAVPITALKKVMTQLGPHTREDGVVIDITSLKEKPIRIMLRHCRGEVIGSHPMFGPRVASLNKHTVFLCPARSNQWVKWFRHFLEARGARVVEIDPVKHDRLMSRVQVLRHMFVFCFGRSLMRLAFDPDDDASVAGPWFSDLVAQLTNQLDQAPDLYADLTLFNPDSEEVVNEFFQAADEVTGHFASGDRDKIVGLINELASYWRPESQHKIPTAPWSGLRHAAHPAGQTSYHSNALY